MVKARALISLRASIATLSDAEDQKHLIDSIIRNYPLPAIFLYQRLQTGKCNDVIDGKQSMRLFSNSWGFSRVSFPLRPTSWEADPRSEAGTA
jgi:hypothetical protein